MSERAGGQGSRGAGAGCGSSSGCSVLYSGVQSLGSGDRALGWVCAEHGCTARCGVHAASSTCAACMCPAMQASRSTSSPGTAALRCHAMLADATSYDHAAHSSPLTCHACCCCRRQGAGHADPPGPRFLAAGDWPPGLRQDHSGTGRHHWPEGLAGEHLQRLPCVSCPCWV